MGRREKWGKEKANKFEKRVIKSINMCKYIGVWKGGRGEEAREMSKT